MEKSNRIRESEPVFTAVTVCFAVFAALITLYPMYYVVILSISRPSDVIARNVYLWPTGFYTASYRLILRDAQLWLSLRNSVTQVLLTTALKLIICVFTAYPLAMPKLAGRRFVVWFLLVPMYFSGGMIPSFLNITQLGLYNMVWAVVLPASLSIYHFILTRSYFSTSIPATLREAAMIDGANHYQTLFSIYIPLSKPILAVVSIYTIVGVWNSWFSSTIYLTSPSLHPLQMYLKKMLVDNSAAMLQEATSAKEAEDIMKAAMVKTQLQYSAIVVTTVPVLLVYPFLQKYFVKGIMIGSLKG